MKNSKENWLHYLIIIILILLIVSCNTSRRILPVEEGWEMIGETNVNFVRDRDQMNIMSTNRYSAIRFKVENKDILLKDMKIIYQNGDRLAPLIDENLPADQFSKDIDLGAEGKQITAIEFNYRSKGSLLKGRAKILAFGKRAVQLYYPVPVGVPVQQ